MPSDPRRSLLPPPPALRRGIPLYAGKSESEYRADPYERYDELVSRQAILHLADDLHDGYPFQPVLELLDALPRDRPVSTIVDVGCSVGRLLAEAVDRNPGATGYGFDFSYQMLRVANDHWCGGQTERVNGMRYGWSTVSLEGRKRGDLHFAQARAGKLPLPDASTDLLLHTFLLDRLEAPAEALAEFHRVLRPGGIMLGITPLNFLSPDMWRNLHPPVRVAAMLSAPDWELVDWRDPFPLVEPLDARGNAVHWRTVAFICHANHSLR